MMEEVTAVVKLFLYAVCHCKNGCFFLLQEQITASATLQTVCSMLNPLTYGLVASGRGTTAENVGKNLSSVNGASPADL
jgi:hypothetical protein